MVVVVAVEVCEVHVGAAVEQELRRNVEASCAEVRETRRLFGLAVEARPEEQTVDDPVDAAGWVAVEVLAVLLHDPVVEVEDRVEVGRRLVAVHVRHDAHAVLRLLLRHVVYGFLHQSFQGF